MCPVTDPTCPLFFSPLEQLLFPAFSERTPCLFSNKVQDLSTLYGRGRDTNKCLKFIVDTTLILETFAKYLVFKEFEFLST